MNNDSGQSQSECESESVEEKQRSCEIFVTRKRRLVF